MVVQISQPLQHLLAVRSAPPVGRHRRRDILRNRLAADPYSGKALVGDLKGFYSVRLSHQDRVVYSIHDAELMILVVRAKTHYGD